MKRMVFPLIVILCLLLSGCQLYDLRPEAMQTRSFDAENAKKARQILEKCTAVHGWDRIDEGVFEVTYIDHWPNFWFHLFFHPWPVKGQKLRQTFRINDLYTSEVQFVGGVRDGEVWGLEHKKAYWEKGKTIKYRKHKDTDFYLPTYQYFFQMPRWFEDIPMLRYYGQQVFNNVHYHVVFGTWETYAPNKEYDQYLFWINAENYRLEMVQYTIREQVASAHGTNTFSDFRKVEGLLIPFVQTITFEPGDEEVMHQIVIDAFNYAPSPGE